MVLTCGIGLTRGKTILKGLFRSKEKQEDDVQSSSSSSRKKRQSKLFGATGKPDDVTSQPTHPVAQAQETPSAAASTQIEEQKPEPEEDMTAAVLSAGDNASEKKRVATTSKDKADVRTSTPPTTIDRNQHHRPTSFEEPLQAKADTTSPHASQPAKSATNNESPSELESPSSKPTSSQIEQAEIKEAQAAAKASRAPGPTSAAQIDRQTADETGRAMKTTIDQAGAAGSMMGMSATSGPLSDLPAL